MIEQSVFMSVCCGKCGVKLSFTDFSMLDYFVGDWIKREFSLPQGSHWEM